VLCQAIIADGLLLQLTAGLPTGNAAHIPEARRHRSAWTITPRRSTRRRCAIRGMAGLGTGGVARLYSRAGSADAPVPCGSLSTDAV
jgi:hypothetical protein